MVEIVELKKKLDEINSILTKIPDNAKVSYFNNSYSAYDKHEGDKAENKIIGVKHSFNISVTFEELFPKQEEDRKEDKDKEQE